MKDKWWLWIFLILALLILMIELLHAQSTSTVTFNIVQTIGPFSTPIPATMINPGQCASKSLSVPGADPVHMHIAWGINTDLTQVSGFVPSVGPPLTWANPYLGAGTATFTICNYTSTAQNFGGATILWSVQNP